VSSATQPTPGHASSSDADGLRALSTEQSTLVEASEPAMSGRRLSVVAKGGSAILGQAFFAGAHFLANVLLARWLPAAQYGAFALAYACFLLIAMLYCGWLYEPLIVYGSGRYAARFGRYIRTVFQTNTALLIPISLLMVATSFLLGRLYSHDVSRAFLALALAAPFMLTTWLGRAGFYAQLKPGKAAQGGAIYFCVLTVWMFVLRATNSLSPPAAFVGMGVAGLLTNLFLVIHLHAGSGTSGDGVTFGMVIGDHWRYGRWAMASALVAWFPENIYYTLLPARTGLEDTAALRALVNLVNPVIHTLIALASVLIPTLVRHKQLGGIRDVRKAMGRLLLILLPGTVCYLTALWLCRSAIFEVLYNGKYQQYSGFPLLLIGLLPVSTTAVMIFGSGLRALEKPESIFWSYVAASATVVFVGIPITLRFGTAGAAGGMLLANVVATGCMAILFKRLAGRERAREQSDDLAT
jgi:O-antigen/teichoic acid export membrane protein